MPGSVGAGLVLRGSLQLRAVWPSAWVHRGRPGAWGHESWCGSGMALESGSTGVDLDVSSVGVDLEPGAIGIDLVLRSVVNSCAHFTLLAPHKGCFSLHCAMHGRNE